VHQVGHFQGSHVLVCSANIYIYITLATIVFWSPVLKLFRTTTSSACYFEVAPILLWVTAIAQWLRCYATNRKVAGSTSAGVSGFFIDIKSLRSHYGPGVDSASNRNE